MSRSCLPILISSKLNCLNKKDLVLLLVYEYGAEVLQRNVVWIGLFGQGFDVLLTDKPSFGVVLHTVLHYLPPTDIDVGIIITSTNQLILLYVGCSLFEEGYSHLEFFLCQVGRKSNLTDQKAFCFQRGRARFDVVFDGVDTSLHLFLEVLALDVGYSMKMGMRTIYCHSLHIKLFGKFY